MGLDVMELVMDCEERFGIELRDDELGEIRTPREIVDLVVSKIETSHETTCLSQQGFYLLRRTLVDRLGLARDDIRPDTALRDVIDESRAVSVWPALGQALQARVWPELVRPTVLTTLMYALTAIVFVATFILFLSNGVLWAAIIAYLAVLAFIVVEFLVTERWRTRIPRNLRTIKDLVPYAGTSDRLAWTREKVALTVKTIIMDQFGLSESDYDEEADLTRDLGLD